VTGAFIGDVAGAVGVMIGRAIAASRNIHLEATLTRAFRLWLVRFHVVFGIKWHRDPPLQNQAIGSPKVQCAVLASSQRMANALETLTNPVPKVIDPALHAVADYGAAAGLACLGMYLRDRNSTLSNFAFLNAGMIVLTSLLTRYPGGAFPVMSFKTHGMMDAVQGAMLAAGPILLGQQDDPDSRYFYGQAALEMGVVAATDWEALG
jgi:hypothetical protein